MDPTLPNQSDYNENLFDQDDLTIEQITDAFLNKLIEDMSDTSIDYDIDTFAVTEASQIGNFDIVNELIKRGYEPHLNNNEAIELASDNGHIDVVRRLLQDIRVRKSLTEQELKKYTDQVKYIFPPPIIPPNLKLPKTYSPLAPPGTPIPPPIVIKKTVPSTSTQPPKKSTSTSPTRTTPVRTTPMRTTPVRTTPMRTTPVRPVPAPVRPARISPPISPPQQRFSRSSSDFRSSPAPPLYRSSPPPSQPPPFKPPPKPSRPEPYRYVPPPSRTTPPPSRSTPPPSRSTQQPPPQWKYSFFDDYFTPKRGYKTQYDFNFDSDFDSDFDFDRPRRTPRSFFDFDFDFDFGRSRANPRSYSSEPPPPQYSSYTPPPYSSYTPPTPVYQSQLQKDIQYLATLGITDRKTWKQWILKHHPDKNPNYLTLVQQVNEAVQRMPSNF